MNMKFKGMEDILWLINGLFRGGLIFDRRVQRQSNSAGRINVHQSLIGKHFKVIMVPLEHKDQEDVLDEKKWDHNVQSNLAKFKQSEMEKKMKKAEERARKLEEENQRLKVDKKFKETNETVPHRTPKKTYNPDENVKVNKINFEE